MKPTRPEDFYALCAAERTYARPDLKAKHRRQFDQQVWRPAAFRADMSVLEVGCGSGLFLAFLHDRGVADFMGVDAEPRILDAMPPQLAERVTIAEVDAFLDEPGERRFDRIVLLDVFEHFSPYEGVALLERLGGRLAGDGRIVLRLPNAGSPLGLRFQFGDLTHQAAYTPDSLAQAALAGGFAIERCLGVRRGGPLRRLAQRAAEGVAGWLFAERPEIWQAVFIAVLARR